MLMDRTVPVDIDDFSDDFTHCFTGECRVNVLPILFQISQIITESEDLASSLAVMLKVMRERLKIVRAMVTLYDRQSETIFLHESFGLTEEQKSRGIYSPVKVSLARLWRRGKPLIVPRLRDHPGCLDERCQQGRHMNTSFFCVPIMHGKKVLGTDQRRACLYEPPAPKAGRGTALHHRPDDRASRRAVLAGEHRQGPA